MAETDLESLLDAAASILRERVIPATSAETRFAALMVASAVGMAQREILLTPQLRAAERDVAAMAPSPSPFASPAQALTMLIREGLMDADPDLHRRLLVHAITRTAITRPQMVAEAERRLAGLD